MNTEQGRRPGSTPPLAPRRPEGPPPAVPPAPAVPPPRPRPGAAPERSAAAPRPPIPPPPATAPATAAATAPATAPAGPAATGASRPAAPDDRGSVRPVERPTVPLRLPGPAPEGPPAPARRPAPRAEPAGTTRTGTGRLDAGRTARGNAGGPAATGTFRVPPRPAGGPPARPAADRAGGAPGRSAPAVPAVPPVPPVPSVPVPGPAPRPVPAAPPRKRQGLRLAAALTCLVLGTGLLGGAITGVLLSGGSGGPTDAGQTYEHVRGLWQELPVDTLFPPELTGEGAGPGSADRRWIRAAVAPDDDCAGAFDPLLAEVLDPLGCHRLLRATYLDDTRTTVTTVGMLFTEADAADMAALRTRLDRDGLAERADLLPRTFPGDNPATAGFGDAQRATWTIRALPKAPVVVYAVTGFADGRPVETPRPAGPATAAGQDSVVALAGLAHDAEGIADRVERRFRKAAQHATEEPR
ncbi:hypothetical protein [Streptomyces aidingensis]|uniref:Uncharacterized protein n=1 Tax=Streptomyces aidingensis TaxID=910347 RepID=A0A1I1RYG7_9ACTN|nr:hypothetical protein [Streptomyces aidingensis]SFD39127.1 hypothetical protein SAMN05421773_11479 [Streptomyces aidingensis]